MMDVARYLYLIILIVMMENLLPRTGSVAVTYVPHPHTQVTHKTTRVLCQYISPLGNMAGGAIES